MSPSRMFVIGGAIITVALAVPILASADTPMGMGLEGVLQRGEVEARIKNMFGKLDTDKDGTITRAEAQSGREAMRGKMLAHHFDKLDADKNGSVSRDEFVAGHHMPDSAKAGEEHKMHAGMGHGGNAMRLFDRADGNKDGKVTLNEATEAALKHFDQVDVNHDKQVTPDERRAFHAQRQGDMTHE